MALGQLAKRMEVALTLLEKEIVPEAPRWSLAPSVSKVAGIDEGLRLRLAKSLAYLAEVASLADSHASALATVEQRLKSGPVSPWVFCLIPSSYRRITLASAGSLVASATDAKTPETSPPPRTIILTSFFTSAWKTGSARFRTSRPASTSSLQAAKFSSLGAFGLNGRCLSVSN